MLRGNYFPSNSCDLTLNTTLLKRLLPYDVKGNTPSEIPALPHDAFSSWGAPARRGSEDCEVGAWSLPLEADPEGCAQNRATASREPVVSSTAAGVKQTVELGNP